LAALANKCSAGSDADLEFMCVEAGMLLGLGQPPDAGGKVSPIHKFLAEPMQSTGDHLLCTITACVLCTCGIAFYLEATVLLLPRTAPWRHLRTTEG